MVEIFAKIIPAVMRFISVFYAVGAIVAAVVPRKGCVKCYNIVYYFHCNSGATYLQDAPPL